ncbi:MAG: class I SAM-dependent methyltransferase [Wenzhouxiangellaceae bacterium]|nr:class I SAM-dependent methyltransferase [Wenzhouxiangellaceae bacterium]
MQADTRTDVRKYWRCAVCLCTFVDPWQRPGQSVEKREYDQHCNDVEDPRYRRFLSRLARPLLARLGPSKSGLDYGCGPGPALAAMLTEAGHELKLWDPIYQPDRSVFERRYDFISCTEVVEHMHEPAVEFARIDTLLKPGGWLAIMTQFQTDDARFERWHYRRDPTHVIFYREQTFGWLAEKLGWTLEVPERNVVLMQKPGDC